MQGRTTIWATTVLLAVRSRQKPLTLDRPDDGTDWLLKVAQYKKEADPVGSRLSLHVKVTAGFPGSPRRTWPDLGLRVLQQPHSTVTALCSHSPGPRAARPWLGASYRAGPRSHLSNSLEVAPAAALRPRLDHRQAQTPFAAGRRVST